MTAASHIVTELGLSVAVDGPLGVGRAVVTPEICIPGTAVVRTSVLATWADVITGTMSMPGLTPRIPVTLDLETQVFAPPAAGDTVTIEATITKRGRTVLVCEAWFRVEGSRSPVALSLASFIASPNPTHVLPDDLRTSRPRPAPGRLAVPFAERAQCAVPEPGTAEVPRVADGLNAAGSIQGGLVALAAEEAATSLADAPVYLRALTLRYLRPFTVGPARATAERHGHTCLVRLDDAGVGKLSALATAHLAAAPRQPTTRP